MQLSKRIESAVLLSTLIVLLSLLSPAESWSLPRPKSIRTRPGSKSASSPAKSVPVAKQPPMKSAVNGKLPPMKSAAVNGKHQSEAPSPVNGDISSALQVPPRKLQPPSPPMMMLMDNDDEEVTPPLKRNSVLNSATAATLSLMASFVPPDNTASSEQAAKVSIQSFPPTTIQLDLQDIPLLGGMISGTWAKVGPLKKSKPSIVVESPTEKFGAIRGFLDQGRLEFDIGGLIKTHLNVDVEPNDKGGQALIRLSSKLIPKWPFGRNTKSKWNRVTNMGNGELYYFNSATGETQFDEPEEFL